MLTSGPYTCTHTHMDTNINLPTYILSPRRLVSPSLASAMFKPSSWRSEVYQPSEEGITRPTNSAHMIAPFASRQTVGNVAQEQGWAYHAKSAPPQQSREL